MDKIIMYYELSPEYANQYFNGRRYWWSNETCVPRSFTYHTRLMYGSNRVWMEGSGGVKFVKHRYGHTTSPVDMREFFIVKLRSVLMQKELV